jgi:hypothetical protein
MYIVPRATKQNKRTLAPVCSFQIFLLNVSNCTSFFINSLLIEHLPRLNLHEGEIKKSARNGILKRINLIFFSMLSFAGYNRLSNNGKKLDPRVLENYNNFTNFTLFT